MAAVTENDVVDTSSRVSVHEFQQGLDCVCQGVCQEGAGDLEFNSTGRVTGTKVSVTPAIRQEQIRLIQC